MSSRAQAGPAQYAGAGVPPAWAAGSVSMPPHAMPGLGPDAPGGRLATGPVPPRWLPDLTPHGLRPGPHGFDLRSWRRDGGAACGALRGGAGAAIRRRSDAVAA